MKAEPTPQHEWLKQLVGEWSYRSECPAGPDGEALTAEGKEHVRMLGDLWMVGESTGLMPGGGSMTAVMTVGYDPEKERFVGTWVGSPMTAMFVYEGTLDEGARGDVVLRADALQHQHKGLAPVCVDVGCGVSQPAYVGSRRRCHVVIPGYPSY